MQTDCDVKVKQEVIDPEFDNIKFSNHCSVQESVGNKLQLETVEPKCDLLSSSVQNEIAYNSDVKLEQEPLIHIKTEDETSTGITSLPDVKQSNQTILYSNRQSCLLENDRNFIAADQNSAKAESFYNANTTVYSHGDSTNFTIADLDDRAEDEGSFDGKKYKCKFCSKLFVKKSNLRSHERTHTGETPYKCQYCNKGFNVRSNLNVHLRIHTGQRPHECEICKKSFRQAGQLKTHERIHNGEKPYSCNLCSGSFRSSSSLITHLRTHTGEKPFPCDLCSRSFSTSTSLKTHRVTHSGTMLYDCPVCGRQFNRRNNLNVHIKRHNKNRQFSCPMCSNGFVMRAHLLSHLKRTHNVQVDELKLDPLFDVSEIVTKTLDEEKTFNNMYEGDDLESKVKAEDEIFDVKSEGQG